MPAWKRFSWTLPYLRPHWLGLILVSVIGLLSTALSLVQPYLSKLLIDDALLKKDGSALLQIAGLMVLSSLLSFGFNVAAGYLYTRISAHVLFQMRSDLLRHLHGLSPRFYSEWKTGDILSRLNSDISEIQRVVADGLLSILGNVGFLVGSAVILWRMDVGLFLVGVAALPLATLCTWWFRRILVDRVRVMREQSAEIGSFLLNTLLGHRVVTAFGAVSEELSQFDQKNTSYVQALLRMQLTSYGGSGLPGAILAFSTAAVFWVGGNKVIAGTLSVGTLVAFLAYHMRLMAPVQGLMGLYANFVTAQVSLERVEKLFAVQPEVTDATGLQSGIAIQGAIELRGIDFAYGEKQVLKNVNWRLGAGETGVILGPSGRGKSTLADLLARLYDPDAGQVLLDGRNLKEIPLAELRQAVAVVEQTPWMFPATVRENLLYGKQDATDAELFEVLEAVGLRSALPDLSLKVGERGMTLSAGQRQRLAIARALLRRPKVLVLDEPTAALDEANEQLVTEGIRRLLPTATLVLVTHRLKLVDIAQQVLRLD